MMEKQTFFLRIFYYFMGAVSVGNGLWMLFAAQNWYFTLPAGIEDTGPLNTHFVHDIGLVYLISGIGGLYCAKYLTNCWKVHLGVMFFTVGHALIHVVEILIGLLPKSHWLIDLPLIFVPAIFMLAITPMIHKLNFNRPS